MIQILRKPIANLAVPVPLGHAFRDSSDYTGATVAQRNHGLHLARNDYWRSAIGGLTRHLDLVVQLLLAREFSLHIDLHDIEKRLALARNESTRALAAVAIHRDRRHRAEILVEVHGEPPVELRRLPIARSPAMVAQTERVDLELALDAVGRENQSARCVAELLQVTFRELSFGIP